MITIESFNRQNIGQVKTVHKQKNSHIIGLEVNHISSVDQISQLSWIIPHCPIIMLYKPLFLYKRHTHYLWYSHAGNTL